MRGLCTLLIGCIALLPLQLAAEAVDASILLPLGNADRGRLVFAPCRTCHYPDKVMGHNNGPNLHAIFGKVAGKQAGFDYYSATFSEAQFVWTPRVMFTWLEAPMKMFPQSSMMSLGVPDPYERADLIAYLMKASARE